MTDTPDTQNEERYFVFFAAHVEASDPAEAVRLLVERMVEIGLRKWTYRVDTTGDTRDLVGYFDGHGNPLPLPIIDVPLPEDAKAETASSEPSPTLDTETDDADLTAYAGTLNQS